jgi:hypothetical protein
VDKGKIKNDPFYRHALICIGSLAALVWSFAAFAPRQMNDSLEALFFAGLVTVLGYHVFLFGLAGRCKGLSPTEVQSLRRSILFFGPAGVVDFLWRVFRTPDRNAAGESLENRDS